MDEMIGTATATREKTAIRINKRLKRVNSDVKKRWVNSQSVVRVLNHRIAAEASKLFAKSPIWVRALVREELPYTRLSVVCRTGVEDGELYPL